MISADYVVNFKTQNMAIKNINKDIKWRIHI